jgi:hypothetical protein
MPYYPKTHPRYRTKDEIAQDVSFALKSKLSPAAKYAVLKDAMWTWTELEGKYKGCQYWTPLAFALHHANRKAKKKPGSGLRHEHIVPKSVVYEILCGLEHPTRKAVFQICDKLLIGVVVTVPEDLMLNQFRSTMPPEFHDPASPDHLDPWLRYKRCNVPWRTEIELRDLLSAFEENDSLDPS